MKIHKEKRKSESHLMNMYDSLNEQAQAKLLSYAEFLCAQPENVQTQDTSRQLPKAIPAADNESVVGAIKRLSDSYFMLDRAKLLDSCSTLMAQHVMQGRDAIEVVKELEARFANEYEQYCDAIEKSGANKEA